MINQGRGTHLSHDFSFYAISTMSVLCALSLREMCALQAGTSQVLLPPPLDPLFRPVEGAPNSAIMKWNWWVSQPSSFTEELSELGIGTLTPLVSGVLVRR